jgi:hypothetical protein
MTRNTLKKRDRFKDGGMVSNLITGRLQTTEHFQVLAITLLGQIPGADDDAHPVCPAKKRDFGMLRRVPHYDGKDIPAQALLGRCVPTIYQYTNAGPGQLLLALDEVADRFGFLGVRFHLQEPARTLNFKEVGVECECRGDTELRLASALGSLPQVKGLSSTTGIASPSHNHSRFRSRQKE